MLTTREVIMLGLIDALRDAVNHPESPYDIDGELESLFGYVRHMRDAEGVPDPMPLGWNRPAPCSTDELVDVLKDALERVSIGDSFEGTITWSMPTDEPELEGSEFGLVARYRVGNLDGQGGLRVFTKEAS